MLSRKIQKKKSPFILFLILSLFSILSFTHCAGPSIFKPIPLDTSPPIIAQPLFLVIDELNARGYLINSNNTVLYSDGSIVAFDLSNPIAPKVIKVAPLPNFSGQGILDAATKTLYVTNRLSETKSDTNDQILKINIDENSPDFLSYQQFQTGNNPFGIASDGANLFVVNQQSLDSFLFSNLSSRTEVNFNILVSDGSIPNTVNTRQMTISPSGNFLYVTNQGGPVLILNKSQIPTPDPNIPLTDGGNNSVDYIISNTTSTLGAASDNQYIYIVESIPASLLVLSDKTLAPVTGDPQTITIGQIQAYSIPLGPLPNEIALDTANHRAYITLAQDNQLSVIDTTAFVEIARVPLSNTSTFTLPAGINQGQSPFGVSVGHFGGVPYIYIMNLFSNNISIVNGNTLSVVATYP